MVNDEEKNVEEEYPSPESRPFNDEEQEVYDALVQHFADKDFHITHVQYLSFVRGYWHETPRLEKTIEIMEKAMTYRKKMELDTIIERKSEDAEAFRRNEWQWHVHGCDKQGHPVYWESTGKIDPNTILSNGRTIDDLLDYHMVMMEKVVNVKAQATEKLGHFISKHVVVMDLDGLGMKHCSKTFYGPIQKFIDIDQYYYPESLVHLFIINVPWVFKMLWNVAKGWLDPITRKRISVCGADYLEKIKEYVAEDQIPKHYSGKDCSIENCPWCENNNFEDFDFVPQPCVTDGSGKVNNEFNWHNGKKEQQDDAQQGEGDNQGEKQVVAK